MIFAFDDDLEAGETQDPIVGVAAARGIVGQTALVWLPRFLCGPDVDEMRVELVTFLDSLIDGISLQSLLFQNVIDIIMRNPFTIGLREPVSWPVRQRLWQVVGVRGLLGFGFVAGLATDAAPGVRVW